jgi:N utilization substance protein B
VGARHTTRRIAAQALYGLDANPDQGWELALEAALSESKAENIDRERLKALLGGTWKRREEIDKAISSASANWKLSRMDRMDRSILRLGIFELMAEPDVPAPVVLSEAVELAKKFGTPDSPAFINGLLDRVARELRADEVKKR